MNQSTRKSSTKSNDDALAAFVSKKAEIDTMLTRLRALSDDHFNTSPDDVTWADVGSLEAYAELLKRITDQAFNAITPGSRSDLPHPPRAAAAAGARGRRRLRLPKPKRRSRHDDQD
jgi:hypothetical protein